MKYRKLGKYHFFPVHINDWFIKPTMGNIFRIERYIFYPLWITRWFTIGIKDGDL